ncbi:hypothetical protein ACFFQF_16005 [Haladaptatus pallidirubidus]|uniref:hypothetical protein n=1 Tax=Haladaptatus pallidirubidus TaxID=1008152 RepID=UPI0035EF10FF
MEYAQTKSPPAVRLGRRPRFDWRLRLHPRRGNQTNDDGDRARSGDLETIGIDGITEGESGNLVVVVNIKNHGDSKSSAPLKVSATIDGTVHEKTPKVTVPGGQTKAVRIPFEVEYAKYDEASRTSIDLDLR